MHTGNKFGTQAKHRSPQEATGLFTQRLRSATSTISSFPYGGRTQYSRTSRRRVKVHKRKASVELVLSELVVGERSEGQIFGANAEQMPRLACFCRLLAKV